MQTTRRFDFICMDWGGTLMPEEGPEDVPMGLWPELTCIPGAREAVELLHRTHSLCIATNATLSSRPMIARALERVDLLQYFAEIFCFTELGFRKDDQRFWSFVSHRLATPSHKLAMVGDTLEQDVIAPRRFGIYAIWFNQDGRQAQPTVAVPTVTHLSELHSLIEAVS